MLRSAIPLLAIAVLWAAPGAQAQETGTVTVIHGVPGLVVDVYVNGDLTLPDFEPGTVTGALELPAGNYDIAIRAAGSAPDSEPAIAGSAALEAGANVTIVAHLTEDGTPTLGLFANDLSPVDDGNGRVVVAHTAAAPAVDIRVRRLFSRTRLKIEDLSNGNNAQADVRGGFYLAWIFAAGTRQRVAGPVFLFVRPGQTLSIYAVGSLAGGSFQLLSQRIDIPPPAVGNVTVVHGIPGLDVDVYVNGALAIPGFTPDTITDPIELDAGDYDVAIRAAGADPTSDPVLTASATVNTGDNLALVAHLQEDGTPTISAFANDVSPVPFRRSRLVVRHLAAAPAVDISLRRYWRRIGTLEGVVNGDEAQLDGLRSGKYRVSIFPAGGDDAVFSAKLRLRSRTAYFVYAVGSLADGTFRVLVDAVKTERSRRKRGGDHD